MPPVPDERKEVEKRNGEDEVGGSWKTHRQRG